MKTKYFDLIDQTFYFPSYDFGLANDQLTFHGIPLTEVAEKFGTPLKLTYIPKIGDQVEKARRLFGDAMRKPMHRVVAIDRKQIARCLVNK